MQLSAVSLLVEVISQPEGVPAVIVAPDVGAAKRAEMYARALDLPVAIVHKSRVTGSEVSAHGLVGEVRGCKVIIVDDMVSTGATIEAAVRLLVRAGCREGVLVVATHALLVGGAPERLAALPIERFVTTDSVPLPKVSALPLQVVSLASLLAEEIRRIEGAR